MLVWIVFIAVISIFLAIDLGIFNKEAHVISTKEASKFTALWVSIALAFSGVIYWLYSGNHIENPTNLTPTDATLKYVTGYLIELSLSIDNIFVIAVIFKSFGIPQKYQHRVLFWGIAGAIVFRALMIFFGIILINKFSWLTYVFGIFLIYTAYKMINSQEDEYDPKKSAIYRYSRRIFPVTPTIHGQEFFVKRRHITAATPLFLALIMIEATDILFALDSIPAILAITSDPFLVFTSNILAIMGLRSMYFFIANLLGKFQYIHYSLVVILAFVGIKMLLVHYYHFPEWVSLGVIFLALAAGILLSLRKGKTLEQ